MSVVVVIGLQDVQPAELFCQPGSGRLLGKGGVSIAAEEPEPLATVDARSDDVETAIVVEVVDDHAAGRRNRNEPGTRSDIMKTSDLFGRRECAWRDEVRERHLRRVSAGEHMRKVQQPTHLEL